MTTYCAPCLADLALVREAVTAVSGTAACMAHAVMLTHVHDTPQRRLTRLTELRTLAEGKLATASAADAPAIEILIQEYALAGAMDMTVPLRDIAGDRSPRPPKGRRERGPRPERERGPRPEGERGPRPDRGPRPERTQQPATDVPAETPAATADAAAAPTASQDAPPAPVIEAPAQDAPALALEAPAAPEAPQAPAAPEPPAAPVTSTPSEGLAGDGGPTEAGSSSE